MKTKCFEKNDCSNYSAQRYAQGCINKMNCYKLHQTYFFCLRKTDFLKTIEVTNTMNSTWNKMDPSTNLMESFLPFCSPEEAYDPFWGWRNYLHFSEKIFLKSSYFLQFENKYLLNAFILVPRQLWNNRLRPIHFLHKWFYCFPSLPYFHPFI